MIGLRLKCTRPLFLECGPRVLECDEDGALECTKGYFVNTETKVCERKLCLV